MGPEGAHGFFTLDPDDNRDLSKKQWDALRFGMFCTSAESLGNIKATIHTLCSITNRCTYDAAEKIQAFFDVVDELDEKAQQMREDRVRVFQP